MYIKYLNFKDNLSAGVISSFIWIGKACITGPKKLISLSKVLGSIL